ncbi:MAG: PAS domain-containing protein [Methylobacter sp.]
MEEDRFLSSKEIQIKKTAVLISRTNLDGIIFYANDEFVSSSGFTLNELISTRHNIIHHFDVPQAVVEDLWMTLKALRPWQGIVKNKTKSGDYYWTETSVMPVFKNGKVHEYLFLRRAPRRERIEQAEHLHGLLNDKYKIIKPTGLAAVVKPIKEAYFWKKIALALTALLLPIIYLMCRLLSEQDYQLLVSVAVSVAIAAAISFNVTKNFSAILNKIIGIFYCMVEKKFGNMRGLACNDLFVDIQRTLYLMEVNLDLAQAREKAARSLQISRGEDHVHMGVMLTKSSFEVICMNDSVLEMFKKAGNAANSLHSANLDADNSPMEPVQQQRLSANFKVPYVSELHIAGQVIRFSINS